MRFVKKALKDNDKYIKKVIEEDAGGRMFFRTKFATIEAMCQQTEKVIPSLSKKSGIVDQKKQQSIDLHRKINCYLQKASYRTNPGRVKPQTFPNQDAYALFVDETIKCMFLCVADGHGRNGHYVSNVSSILLCRGFLEKSQHFKKTLDARMWKILFQNAENETVNVDNRQSGCTCSIVVLTPGECQIVTVGDSDIFLVNKPVQARSSVVYQQLNTPDNPNDPKERMRVHKMGGTVAQPTGDPTFRVMPLGLAVSRAIGDTLGNQLGIICEPHVHTFPLGDPLYLFLCIGSDGVWDELTPTEASNIYTKHAIVNGFGMKQSPTAHEMFRQATKEVVEAAQGKYLQATGTYADDATLVTVNLPAFFGEEPMSTQNPPRGR